MSNCSTCPSKDGCNNEGSCSIENNPYNKVKKIVAVMSGKGGVGKSTVSVLLARDLRKKGYSVGILDADITGPSIPRLLNISEKRAQGVGEGIEPVETKEGIKAMSLNFLIDEEDQPVIWRGPMITGAVKQFWTDVLWGELDYLIIDMPPGTGDVTLTVMQSIPISGVVMVSLPQDMVSMIVTKAVNMARKLEVKLLGVVENMSYIICPDCSKKIRIYPEGIITEFVSKTGLPLLAELPMCADITALTEGGENIINDEIKDSIDTMTSIIIKSLS